ncbi:pyridoxal phosphate phosphatase PHOSPHO2-like [Olea europaea subsp. europaea]|uniref:Pyridoxal phosphate phosphatase PHOSPHO2-like n=1 Tax=Olea europaea subsp. europaea TaxID=158383 RepID=A0A8S0TM36_OLEEU|nr:pyridoxal phosphate phosphatase PHOSPHO2-like [Olea europaea subsp. europaea]
MAKISIDSKFKKLIQRELVVFDFDDTLVDCNSDTWIHKLAPGGAIPEELEFKPDQDYFKHVQSVLAYLHAQGVTEQQYNECLSNMPSVAGMIEPLINTLASKPDKFDMIILSDANSYFISAYLKAKSLDTAIGTVLTNPARFLEDGLLAIDEYHVQDYCTMSSRNLCKGEALKSYIGKRMLEHNTVYTCINYVGDGENDLCPSTKLSTRDRVFPRAGFTLARLCNRLKLAKSQIYMGQQSQTEKSKVPELKATVVPWTTGEEILETILGESHTLV